MDHCGLFKNKEQIYSVYMNFFHPFQQNRWPKCFQTIIAQSHLIFLLIGFFAAYGHVSLAGFAMGLFIKDVISIFAIPPPCVINKSVHLVKPPQNYVLPPLAQCIGLSIFGKRNKYLLQFLMTFCNQNHQFFKKSRKEKAYNRSSNH